MAETTKKRKWVTRAIIIFAAGLLLLTFFSNTIMNLMIPKVMGKRASRGNLAYTNNATAQVDPVVSYRVKSVEGRSVDQVMVSDYDEVKKGDVLMTLNPVDDMSGLDDLKSSLKELEREEEYAKRTPSETDYAQLKISVTQAKAALTDAKATLAAAKKKKSTVDAAKKTIKKNKPLSLKYAAEVESASGSVETISGQIDDIKGDTPADKAKKAALKSKLKKARKRLTKASKKLAECNTAIEKAQGKIEEAKNLPSVSEAKLAVQSAQATLDSAKKQLKNAKINDGIDSDKAKDESTDRKTKISALKTKIAAMEEGYNMTELTAPADGRVFGLTIGEGDTMEKDQTVLTIVPEDTSFTATFRFDSESIKGLQPGMDLKSDEYWLDSCTVETIKPDPENPRESKLVKCSLAAEYILPGESVTVTAGRSNSEYDHCIASSAVNRDNSGEFVYLIEEVRSPFGNRYSVKRVDVSVEATDGSVSAISGEGLDQGMIVIRSEKALEDGDRVRLEDYSGK